MYRDSIALLTFCICFLSVLTTPTLAYHPTSGAYETAQNNWVTTITNLERAISHLENLDSKAGDIEVNIDVNNEELRDALLASPQHYSTEVISAWARARSAATLIGYDIYDGIIHQANRDVQRTQKIVEERQTPKTEAPPNVLPNAKRR